MEVKLKRPYRLRWRLGAALCSSTAPSRALDSFCAHSYQARFKVQKGICLTILDEAYVSKIAVLRETNSQDCNPAQIGSFLFFFKFYFFLMPMSIWWISILSFFYCNRHLICFIIWNNWMIGRLWSSCVDYPYTGSRDSRPIQ